MDRFHTNWAPKIQYYVEKWRSTGCARNSAIYQIVPFAKFMQSIDRILMCLLQRMCFPGYQWESKWPRSPRLFQLEIQTDKGAIIQVTPHPTPRQRHFVFAPQSHIYIKDYIYMIHKRGDIDLISTFQGKDCVIPHTVSYGISFLILILAYMFKSARAIIIHTSEHFPPSFESS